MMRHVRLGVWVICAAVLAGAGGCEDMFTPTVTRNFDELIPRMIGAINKGTPEEAAANLFNVTSPDERRDAIAYLQTKSWGHQPPYMRAYEILTTDPHPMVRAQAMRALGTSYQAAAGEYLAKGLSDADVQVRRDAAYGLITTWDDAAFGPLAVHVDSDVDDFVRGYCARALGHGRTAETVRALIDALKDKDAAVASFAQKSLVSATGQNFGFDAKGWLTWYQQTYVGGAAGATASQPK